MKQSLEGSSRGIARRYHGTSVSMWVLIGAISLFSAFFVLDSPRTSSALTTVPTKMNFQGRLTDSSGNIKPDGTYNMKLQLFTVNSGGSAVWTEDRLVSATQGVTVTNGLFSIKLGDITPLPANLFASGELYLEVELPTPATATSAAPVWTEGPMTPRNQMATSAYAYNAETLDGIDSAGFGQIASNNTWTGTNTITVQSASAFQVQNGSATDIFKVDTVSQRVTVGASTSAARLGVEGAGGLVWTSRTAAEANDWNGITYGNGLYVAVSTMGTNQVMTSPDGITWTARTAAINGSIAVTYGNGLFVAVSYISNEVMTSPDGITWTARTVPELNRWWSVTYGNGLFVAVSEDGTNRVMTSPDGITWTARAAAEANQWQAVTYGNGLFVAVAATGTNRVMTSPDGITWTARSASEAAQYRSVTYGNGQFVALGDGTNPTMTSPDGITWTGRAAPANGGWNNWYEITYGNGQFVAIANGGTDQVMTSSDGITWTAGSVPVANSWQAVTYGNEQFVAVSYDGTNRVMTSKDIAVSARGSVYFSGSVTSNGSFGVRDITGTVNVLTVDTSASAVRIGPATADANAIVLILDTKNTAGDPVGENGATYYNSNTGKFRCYEAGVWKDCDTSGFASGTTAQRPSSPSEGLQFFDTTTKQLLVYANGKWQGDRSSNTKIVAMGAPTGCSGSTPVASQNFDSADYVVTSCTSAQTTINSAITALPAGGGTVYLMEGTYIIDATITVPSNVTINGSGPATILKLKNGINSDIGLFTVGSVNRVTINNLTLDGNKTNNSAGTQTGISLGAAGSGSGASAIPGISLDSLEITNFRSDGIRHNGGTTANGSITRVSTINNSGNGIFLFTSATNMSITDNLSHGNSGIGMDLYGVTNSTISGNTLSGNGSEGGLKLNSPNNAVTNNTISANASGISLAGNYQVVSDNNIFSNTGTGIVVGSSANYSSISNNYIGSNGNGISLSSTSSIRITDNTLRGNSGTAINIDLSQLSLIAGNYLYDNGGTGSSSSIVLSAGCCGGSNDNRVIDNFITDTAGTGYAISITNGSRNYLSGNTYSGTGASSIFDSAVDTVYANQQDSNGNLLNRGTNGFAVGALSASSTLTVQGGYVGQALSSPAQPTGATQGTAGTTSYSYVVTALDGVGETLPSTTRTITTGNATLNGTNFNRITWVRVSGAVQYKVYRTASAGTPATTGLIGTISANAALQLDDTGLAASGAVPVTNTTGGASIAGSLQGSSASLSGDLTVTGATALNGTFTATGTVLFKNTSNSTTALEIQNSSSTVLLSADTTNMKVTVRTLEVTLNLTVNGHIISGGTAPTIAAGDGGCTSPTIVTVTGTDTAGYIRLRTGTNCSALGSGENMVTVTFNTAYASTPVVVLTPASLATSESFPTYISSTGVSTTSFTISAGIALPSDNTDYEWRYHVIQ